MALCACIGQLIGQHASRIVCNSRTECSISIIFFQFLHLEFLYYSVDE